MPPDAVNTPWRLFLAVPLSPEARAAAATVIDDLRPRGWPVRWVNPADAHVTLHFLGDSPRERAELLRLALPTVVARHAKFDLRTGPLGVFPNLRQPRVLWLGLYGPAHRLQTLHDALGATLRGLDFAVEADEPFHPHITLGRARPEGSPEMPLRDLPKAVRALADPATGVIPGPPAAPLPVHRVDLIRSHLSHAGARYEVVASFPLADSNPPAADRAARPPEAAAAIPEAEDSAP